VLWRQAVLPALLYGAEVIPYTKEWIRTVERAQNKVGRWILGVRQSTSAAGVRAELGWLTVEGEIQLRKVKFWDRVNELPSTRWAKQAVQEVSNENYRSDWLSATRKAKERLEVAVAPSNQKSRKHALHRKLVKLEQEAWDTAKCNMTSLKPHPKDNLLGVDTFIWEDSKRRTTLCKLRLGDIGKRWGEGKDICEACEESGIEDMRMHILLDCKQVEQERGTGYLHDTIRTCRHLGMNRLQTTRELLASTSSVGMDSLHRLWKKWDNLSEK
jgi:hypothetical protein